MRRPASGRRDRTWSETRRRAARRSQDSSSANSAFPMASGDDHRDVVEWLTRSELSERADCALEKVRSGGDVAGRQDIGETFGAELYAMRIERIGHPVGIQRQDVAVAKLHFPRDARPVVEHPEDAARRVQPLSRAAAAQQKRRRMAAVDEAKPVGPIIVDAEEERRIARGRRADLKQLIDRRQQRWQIGGVHRELAAQLRLKVRHQQRGPQPFSRDVANDKTELPSSEVKEVKVVAANMSRLYAHPRVLERFELRSLS